MYLPFASSCTDFSAAMTKCNNESYSSEVKGYVGCFSVYTVNNPSSRAYNKL